MKALIFRNRGFFTIPLVKPDCPYTRASRLPVFVLVSPKSKHADISHKAQVVAKDIAMHILQRAIVWQSCTAAGRVFSGVKLGYNGNEGN